MKKLTIRPRIGEKSFSILSQLVNSSLPENFKSFMKLYAGLSHYEYIYVDMTNTKWEIAQYNIFSELYKLTSEFIEHGWGKKLPFAYDPGGWHFCLSFEEGTFGKILINRCTDHSREEQFVVIADSFEDFINGLQRNPEEKA